MKQKTATDRQHVLVPLKLSSLHVRLVFRRFVGPRVRKILSGVFILGAFMSLISCATTVEQYKGKTPELKLEKFFNGPSKAWGAVLDRSGNVTRRFTADLVGEWQGDTGTLSESFVYDDGEIQKRQWNLKITGPNSYSGTADDVEGVGLGNTAGFAMNWKYVLKIKVKDTTYNIPFDDSMFLVDEKTVINRARMSKFGFHVGDIIIFIQKI